MADELHSLNWAQDAASTEGGASSMLDPVDRILSKVFHRLQASNLRQSLSEEEVGRQFVEAVRREWLRGLSFYQPYYNKAAEAASSMISQSAESKVLRGLQRLQSEIYSHGETALRDYCSLGGEIDFARSQPPISAVYAVASVWAMFAQEREPFSCLGALYAADLTTKWVMASLFDHRSIHDCIDERRLELPSFWAGNGFRRALVERAILQKVAKNDPVLWEWINCGVERVIQVYPVPICEEIERCVLSISG